MTSPYLNRPPIPAPNAHDNATARLRLPLRQWHEASQPETIIDAHRGFVARVHDIAKGALIVRAVNAHDDLVDALRGLLNCVPDGNIMTEQNAAGDPSWPYIAAARAALAKAQQQ